MILLKIILFVVAILYPSFNNQGRLQFSMNRKYMSKKNPVPNRHHLEKTVTSRPLMFYKDDLPLITLVNQSKSIAIPGSPHSVTINDHTLPPSGYLLMNHLPPVKNVQPLLITSVENRYNIPVNKVNKTNLLKHLNEDTPNSKNASLPFQNNSEVENEMFKAGVSGKNSTIHADIEKISTRITNDKIKPSTLYNVIFNNHASSNGHFNSTLLKKPLPVQSKIPLQSLLNNQAVNHLNASKLVFGNSTNIEKKNESTETESKPEKVLPYNIQSNSSSIRPDSGMNHEIQYPGMSKGSVPHALSPDYIHQQHSEDDEKWESLPRSNSSSIKLDGEKEEVPTGKVLETVVSENENADTEKGSALITDTEKTYENSSSLIKKVDPSLPSNFTSENSVSANRSTADIHIIKEQSHQAEYNVENVTSGQTFSFNEHLYDVNYKILSNSSSDIIGDENECASLQNCSASAMDTGKTFGNKSHVYETRNPSISSNFTSNNKLSLNDSSTEINLNEGQSNQTHFGTEHISTNYSYQSDEHTSGLNEEMHSNSSSDTTSDETNCTLLQNCSVSIMDTHKTYENITSVNKTGNPSLSSNVTSEYEIPANYSNTNENISKKQPHPLLHNEEQFIPEDTHDILHQKSPEEEVPWYPPFPGFDHEFESSPTQNTHDRYTPHRTSHFPHHQASEDQNFSDWGHPSSIHTEEFPKKEYNRSPYESEESAPHTSSSHYLHQYHYEDDNNGDYNVPFKNPAAGYSGMNHEIQFPGMSEGSVPHALFPDYIHQQHSEDDEKWESLPRSNSSSIKLDGEKEKVLTGKVSETVVSESENADTEKGSALITDTEKTYENSTSLIKKVDSSLPSNFTSESSVSANRSTADIHIIKEQSHQAEYDVENVTSDHTFPFDGHLYDANYKTYSNSSSDVISDENDCASLQNCSASALDTGKTFGNKSHVNETRNPSISSNFTSNNKLSLNDSSTKMNVNEGQSNQTHYGAEHISTNYSYQSDEHTSDQNDEMHSNSSSDTTSDETNCTLLQNCSVSIMDTHKTYENITSVNKTGNPSLSSNVTSEYEIPANYSNTNENISKNQPHPLLHNEEQFIPEDTHDILHQKSPEEEVPWYPPFPGFDHEFESSPTQNTHDRYTPHRTSHFPHHQASEDQNFSDWGLPSNIHTEEFPKKEYNRSPYGSEGSAPHTSSSHYLHQYHYEDDNNGDYNVPFKNPAAGYSGMNHEIQFPGMSEGSVPHALFPDYIHQQHSEDDEKWESLPRSKSSSIKLDGEKEKVLTGKVSESVVSESENADTEKGSALITDTEKTYENSTSLIKKVDSSLPSNFTSESSVSANRSTADIHNIKEQSHQAEYDVENVTSDHTFPFDGHLYDASYKTYSNSSSDIISDENDCASLQNCSASAMDTGKTFGNKSHVNETRNPSISSNFTSNNKLSLNDSSTKMNVNEGQSNQTHYGAEHISTNYSYQSDEHTSDLNDEMHSNSSSDTTSDDTNCTLLQNCSVSIMDTHKTYENITSVNKTGNPSLSSNVTSEYEIPANYSNTNENISKNQPHPLLHNEEQFIPEDTHDVLHQKSPEEEVPWYPPFPGFDHEFESSPTQNTHDRYTPHRTSHFPHHQASEDQNFSEWGLPSSIHTEEFPKIEYNRTRSGSEGNAPHTLSPVYIHQQHTGDVYNWNNLPPSKNSTDNAYNSQEVESSSTNLNKETISNRTSPHLINQVPPEEDVNVSSTTEADGTDNHTSFNKEFQEQSMTLRPQANQLPMNTDSAGDSLKKHSSDVNDPWLEVINKHRPSRELYYNPVRTYTARRESPRLMKTDSSGSKKEQEKDPLLEIINKHRFPRQLSPY